MFILFSEGLNHRGHGGTQRLLRNGVATQSCTEEAPRNGDRFFACSEAQAPEVAEGTGA